MEQIILSKGLAVQDKIEALTILVTGRSSPEQVWDCVQSLVKAENALHVLTKSNRDNVLMESILFGGGF
ncbi:MAG: hypothetical protein EXS48_02280 [Candidatus Staskawiczbacteria bacterium]|nr:hypothetical protein [Candidatus Staskawiczbacteria bacterium]